MINRESRNFFFLRHSTFTSWDSFVLIRIFCGLFYHSLAYFLFFSLSLKRIFDQNLKICFVFFFWGTCSQSHRCLWWKADPRDDRSQTANGQPYPEVDSQSIGLRRDQHGINSTLRCGGWWIPKILLFLLALRIMIIRRSGSFSLLPDVSFMMKVLSLYGQSKLQIRFAETSLYELLVRFTYVNMK